MIDRVPRDLSEEQRQAGDPGPLTDTQERFLRIVLRNGERLRGVVEVSDTGIGIPEDELPNLFGRFYLTTAAQEPAIPGTGLGLAISRALVTAHGGVIEVDSRPGVGSTFPVRLPRVSAG